LCRQLL